MLCRDYEQPAKKLCWRGIISMVSTCGTTADHSRKMLKKARLLTRPTLARRDAPCPKQSRSRRTGRRRTLPHPPTLSCQDSSFPEWGTLRTCSRREQSWRAFSASCSCLHSPGAPPAPMSGEAIRKGLVSEMWNGIIWNASTRLASRTRSSSTTRALPSLSVRAHKVPPITHAPSMDSQRSTQCGTLA